MRTLKIIEHISLDGVIQVSGEAGGFPYADTQTMPSGIFFSTYKVAGPSKTGRR